VEYRAAIQQGERLCGEVTIAALVAALPRWVIWNEDLVLAASKISRPGKWSSTQIIGGIG